MSFIVFSVSFFKKFSSEKYAKFRGILFLFLGLSGIVPLTHSLFQDDADQFKPGYYYLGLMGLSYIIGVFVFMLRVPERFYPRTFDIIG